MSDDRQRNARKAATELTMTERAFDMLAQAMLEEMMATDVEQVAKREKLFFGMRAIGMAKKALQLAAQDLEVINTQAILAAAGFTSPRP